MALGISTAWTFSNLMAPNFRELMDDSQICHHALSVFAFSFFKCIFASLWIVLSVNCLVGYAQPTVWLIRPQRDPTKNLARTWASLEKLLSAWWSVHQLVGLLLCNSCSCGMICPNEWFLSSVSDISLHTLDFFYPFYDLGSPHLNPRLPSSVLS